MRHLMGHFRSHMYGSAGDAKDASYQTPARASWRSAISRSSAKYPFILSLGIGIAALLALPAGSFYRAGTSLTSQDSMEASDSAEELEKSNAQPTDTTDNLEEKSSVNETSISVEQSSGTSSNETNTHSSSKVEISVDMSSDSYGDSDESEANVSINGVKQDLPESGRFNETIRDGDSKFRIRGNIDADNGSSIRMNIND